MFNFSMGSSYAKFKKIYQKSNKQIEYDNIIDRQMKKIVDEFIVMKKKKEKENEKEKEKEKEKNQNVNQGHPNNNQEIIYNENKTKQ